MPPHLTSEQFLEEKIEKKQEEDEKAQKIADQEGQHERKKAEHEFTKAERERKKAEKGASRVQARACHRRSQGKSQVSTRSQANFATHCFITHELLTSTLSVHYRSP